MTRFSPIIVSSLLLALSACRTEPELNCERVRFGWPHFELDPSADVSSVEGLQIDFSVRSDLLPDALAKLSIGETGPEGNEKILLGEARSDDEGLLAFTNIPVPLGPVLFLIDALGDCGRARTGRRTFVWDGLGQPQCQLSLVSGPAADPVTGVFNLQAEHDEDVDTAGMQVRLAVDAGRPDMQIELLALDRETGTQQDFELSVDASGLGQLSLTLAEGEQAVRALCYWQPQDFRVNTPTRIFLVDSQ